MHQLSMFQVVNSSPYLVSLQVLHFRGLASLTRARVEETGSHGDAQCLGRHARPLALGGRGDGRECPDQ